MEPIWAATYLAATLPFCVVAGWSDLRFMIIRNWVSLCVFTVFIVLGFWVFPLSDLAFRIGIALVVFAVGFLLNQFGLMGGGDVKLIAAMTPFIAGAQWFDFVFGIALWSLIIVGLHKLIAMSPLQQRWFADWKSFDAGRRFPYGLPLALAFVSFLWAAATPL